MRRSVGHRQWMGIAGFCLAAIANTAGQSTAPLPGLVPYSQAPVTDRSGNDWLVEQNGGLARSGSGQSLISGCMSLMLSSQQFYSQQPMITSDGKELVLTSSQPFGGVTVTRRARYLEKEGGMRYVEEFANAGTRDVSVTVELRHSFSGQIQGFVSDKGRAMKDGLQPGESGVAVLPGRDEGKTAALLFVVATPKSRTLPRVSMRNTYQLSFFYSLVVPAGQSVTLVHGVAQTTLPAKPAADVLAKAFKPFALSKLIRDVPKGLAKVAINLQSQARGGGRGDWFPSSLWGIERDGSDVLALGEESRLKGHAECARLVLKHAYGEVTLPWDEVEGLAGERYVLGRRHSVWLRDGQVLSGEVSAEGLRFTLINGTVMDLDVSRLDRLIKGRAHSVASEAKALLQPGRMLVESWNGERLGLAAEGGWDAMSAWGPVRLEWKNLVSLDVPEEGEIAGRARLQDGSSLRLAPAVGRARVQTALFGQQELILDDLRRAVNASAFAQADSPDGAWDDGEPSESFIELAGEERVVARVTTPKLRVATEAGPVELTPASIRELVDVTEDHEDALVGVRPLEVARWHTAELWGGGRVTGQLQDSVLRVDGRGFSWQVPVASLTRLVNPIPQMESSLLRRMGDLIRDLGSEDWKTRETASAGLHELGAMAKGSLQEALRQSTDAEVTRRLELLLQDLE